MQTLSDLNTKFSQNLGVFLTEADTACKELDLKARAIATIGQIASDQKGLQPNQEELTLIFNEVFSDLILAIYFTACALDKPAQSNLRRALELGVAIVYLWDLPHIFWGWKAHDYDLNFNDMIEHISKDSYKSFLKSINKGYRGDDVINYNEIKRLYRTLSNTIHGKISTHESKLPDRFSYNYDDWCYNLKLINDAQSILLNLFKKRFFDYFDKMVKVLPSVIPCFEG